MQAASACGAPLHLWEAHRHPLESPGALSHSLTPFAKGTSKLVTDMRFSQMRQIQEEC